MKNKFFKPGCIAFLVLTLASCVNCQQCREQCAECRGDSTQPAPTPVEGTVIYMMNLNSVKSMAAAAPADCSEFWIVDIPSERPEVPSEEFLLVPVNANRQPITPGNYFKGTRRCPPVCDISGLQARPDAAGNIVNPFTLDNLDEDQQRQLTDRINQAPNERNNSFAVSRTLLAGLMGKPDATVVITCPADGGINIAVVSSFVPSGGGRTHVDL